MYITKKEYWGSLYSWRLCSLLLSILAFPTPMSSYTCMWVLCKCSKLPSVHYCHNKKTEMSSMHPQLPDLISVYPHIGAGPQASEWVLCESHLELNIQHSFDLGTLMFPCFDHRLLKVKEAKSSTNSLVETQIFRHQFMYMCDWHNFSSGIT